MSSIVGVKFKKPGKIYFFTPGKLKLNIGDYVIVETAQGEEYGEVAIANRSMPAYQLEKPLKKVIRLANQEDKKHYLDNKEKEKQAFVLCQKKIKEHNLKMTLTEVEFKFDNSKVLFYFTAEGRVDFRELVKDLAAVYRTRIELRQIGVRDEVKRIGGNGVCGRELCCCSFLNNFETVSIKMAKEQNVSLNPSKISGNCGRLMCCLKYEQEVYEEKLKKLPKIGAIIQTEDGEGIVDGIEETLKEIVRVKLKDENGEYFYKKYDAKDIKIIQNVETEVMDEEEKQNLKELQELENLEKIDQSNQEDDEIL